ncbi:hypothetical protein ACFE04_008593 [Oxalis oulophora]
MQLRESVKRTRLYVNKTIKDLTSLFLGGYQKLPKPPILNPFSCSSRRHWKNHQNDEIYREFYNDWDSELAKKKKSCTAAVAAAKQAVIIDKDEEEDLSFNGSFMKFAKQSPVKSSRIKDQEENTKAVRKGKREDQKSIRMDRDVVLAHKMKELELMDAGDMEHVLDIEEAIHYYSRLKSPVYIDIVDKFLTDVYTEITLPAPQVSSVSINNSKRRFGSMRL